MTKKDDRREPVEAASSADGPPIGSDGPSIAEELEASALGGLPVEPASEALKRVESEHDELKDRYLRLAAEYENFRKRTAKERLDLVERAQASLAIKLLDVLDDLDRVVAGDQTTPREVLHQALVLIDRKLRKELEAAGLERVDPVGNPFDPSIHEAVSTVPPPEPAKDHTVSATFQAGYRFKGALIRPARVQVYSEPGQS